MKYLLFLWLSIWSTWTFGTGYFQQEVNYQINVTLDDVKHRLSGEVDISYHNNSPDTLHDIYVHLWPNAYRSDTTALGIQLLENHETALYYAQANELGRMDSLDFQINYAPATWQFYREQQEIAIIQLNQPLLPGNHLHISTPFRVILPSAAISRLGHIEQAYMVTQWYPKPAVYDQDGWHPVPYLNQGEFYSEFGSFDVNITLPSNYVVGATGELKTNSEISFLDSIAKRTADIVQFGRNLIHPNSNDGFKTITYREKNIHDFAWFADKRFNVLQKDMRLAVNGDSVRIKLLFTDNEADLWKDAVEYVEDAVNAYSEMVGPYPYHEITIVDGTISAGGGMEYPTITVIGESGSSFALETVIMHEIGHNWFYGMLGSNERDHPWMDEGLNTFIESRYISHKYPSATVLGMPGSLPRLSWTNLESKKHKHTYELSYLAYARKGLDQPIGTVSSEFTPGNYGGIVYAKTGLVFRHLMAYLGEEKTDQIFHNYFQKWQYKHPRPSDFRAVAESTSGEDLSWIFDELLLTAGDVDYKIGGLSKGEQTKVEIKNIGQVSAPVIIDIKLKDLGWTQMMTKGFKGSKWLVVPDQADSVIIDRNEEMLDLNRHNNHLAINKVFKKQVPIRFKPLFGLESATQKNWFYTPLAGWNPSNGFMVGAGLFAPIFPNRDWSGYVAPLYGFKDGQVAGRAGLRYAHVWNNVGRFLIGTELKRYSYFHSETQSAHYDKLNPSIQFIPSKKNKRSLLDQKISVEGIFIQYTLWDRESGIFKPGLAQANTNFVKTNYEIKYDHVINPLVINYSMCFGEGFGNASIDGLWKFQMNEEGKKWFTLRGFVGSFLYNNTTNPLINWRMDGQGGSRDYLLENYYIERNATDGILSRQNTLTHGAFKVPTPLGQSNSWLAAINLTADLPVPIPIGVYGDLGISKSSIQASNNASEAILYNGGLYLNVHRDIFQIFVPMLLSNNIHNALGNETIKERIRFTLHLEQLNFFDTILETDVF